VTTVKGIPGLRGWWEKSMACFIGDCRVDQEEPVYVDDYIRGF